MIRRSPGRGHAGERGAGYRRGLRFAGRCQGSVLLSDAAPYCAQAWSITPYFCQTLPEGMLPFLYVFELRACEPIVFASGMTAGEDIDGTHGVYKPTGTIFGCRW